MKPSLYFVLVLASSAHADTKQCEAACTHMNAVSDAEMDREKSLSAETKKKVREDSKKTEPERMKKCVAKCEAGGLDPVCILAATETMGAKGYLKCLTAAKPVEAAKAPGVAADQAKKILGALSTVKADQRLPLLGAALVETTPGPYGADLTPAFEGLQQERAHRAQIVLSKITQALAQLGCAREAANAISLKPELQGSHLAKTCVPDQKLIDPARAENRALDLVALALVIEARARAGGFEKSALHVRAVEILLQAQ